MTHVDTPQSRCRVGIARRDITPPVGIYHRMWGAATHDRSTGIHRPLLATALVCAAEQSELTPADGPSRQVVVSLDHCLFWPAEVNALQDAVCQRADIAPDELQITFSHTHGAGLMGLERGKLPGGELIKPYLDRLANSVIEAIKEASNQLQSASIVYGTGHCDLARNRDFWDADSGQFVCGFNPAGPADDSVLVARITDQRGRTLASLVNYACHPTTLAWDNTLISPDFVGAMREVVEESIGGICLFIQGASGDIGPRDGFVGDTAVADRNGRQLGNAALSALEALPAAGTRFEYAGPVISGATIGTWKHVPLAEESLRDKTRWRVRRWNVELPYRPDLATLDQTESELARWQAQEQSAQPAGDAAAARDCRAQVERMTRQKVRLRTLPPGKKFPLPVVLWQMGDALWLAAEGEHYNLLQRELRRRFPDHPLIISTLTGGWRPTYLPTRQSYGRGMYQESIAVLAPGCLEELIDVLGRQIDSWLAEPVGAANGK